MSSLIHQTLGPDGDSMHQMSIIDDDTTAGNQHLKFPPGLRFQPDDHVLVVNFLQPKILKQPLPLFPDIPVINLYSHNPNDLSEDYPALKNESVFYILTPRDRKYPKGRRPNRAAKGGYWKATGADKEIFHGEEGVLVGFKKTLVFYQGKPPGGQKTNWIMHEYRAKDACHVQEGAKDMKLDDWVLCRLFRKKPAGDKTIPVRDSLDGNVVDGDLDDVLEEISNHFKVLECPDQPVPSDFMGNQIQPGHGNSNIATTQGESADLQSLISSDFTWDEMAKATSGCAEGGGSGVQMAAAGTNVTSAQVLPTHINHMSTPKETEAQHWSSDYHHYGLGVQMAPGDINLTSTHPANTNYMSTRKEAEPHQRSIEAADNYGYRAQTASAYTNHIWPGQEGTRRSGIVNVSRGVPPYTNHIWPRQEGTHWSGGNDNGAYGIQMEPACTTNHVWTGQGGTQWSRGAGSSGDGVQVAPAAYSNCMPVRDEKGTQWSSCGIDDGHPMKKIRLDNDLVANVGAAKLLQPSPL